MTPSWKRVLTFAVLWWIASGIEVGVVGAIPGLGVQTDHGIVFTGAGLLVHFAVLVGYSAGLARAAFRRGRSQRAVVAALSWAAVGLALDAAITVPFLIKSYAAYYGTWSVWVSYALMTATVALVGSRRAAPATVAV